MSKSTGKLKYDLALSTTSVYDASSIYINKSAELSINGNAQLQYITVGATYAENNQIILEPLPNGSAVQGKAYLYVRNLGAKGATGTIPAVKISYGAGVPNTQERIIPVGLPKNLDENQLAELNEDEFMFMPVALGASPSNFLQIRSGFIAGSVNYEGPGYNDIEYMLCFTDHNAAGPSYMQPNS